MRLKRIFRYGLAVGLAVGLAALTGGCFKMAVPDSKPAPVILWPAPPEIPRISFVNAVSQQADLGIADGVVKGFLKYLLGKPVTPMVGPHGVAVDAEGRLYVVDNFLKKVHVYDRQGGKYTLLPEKGDGFVSPIGIAIDDKRGRIYVTDSVQAVVRIFAKGEAEQVAEIKSGGMDRPTGLAVNAAADELLVVDTLHSSIQRYSLADLSLKGIIGLEGSEAGQFHSPTDIAVGPTGMIYVTDALNFRVQVLSPEGKFLRSFGGAGDGPGYFSRPKGLALDGDGNIYVVDALFDNVQVFNAEGELLMAFGKPGQEPGEFWSPSGIFIDRHNTIYVSDSYNKRVQIFQYLKGGELP